METLLNPTDFNVLDHTDLPESDSTLVKNFQQQSQSILLTESIWSKLQQIHPDGQFYIGQDRGIYWRITEPLEKGAEFPGWFYVPDVTPTLNGIIRRSYVLWQEVLSPLIVLELVLGDGDQQRDTTPYQGKFWVYEKGIRVPFYGIYEMEKAKVELYHFTAGTYELMAANERGHYPIESLGVELGIWQGSYKNLELPWLRWWDESGNLLLTEEEITQYSREQVTENGE